MLKQYMLTHQYTLRSFWHNFWDQSELCLFFLEVNRSNMNKKFIFFKNLPQISVPVNKILKWTWNCDTYRIHNQMQLEFDNYFQDLKCECSSIAWMWIAFFWECHCKMTQNTKTLFADVFLQYFAVQGHIATKS